MFFKAVIRVLLAALLALAAACAAQTAPAPPWSGRAVPGQYWVDASGKSALEAARAAFDSGQGRPADPAQVMPLGGGAAIWYRLQLPPASSPVSAVFTVTFPGTDSVELFRPDGAGRWLAQRSGDALPVSEWPVPYLHPTFAFTLQQDEIQATYLRVQNAYPIRVNWVLWDARTFNQTSKSWHLALGAYIGCVLLVILLSAFNTYSWRDPIHVYYAIHVVLVGLSVLSLTGLGGEYLWPNDAWWNDKAPVALPALGVAWAALFVRELVAERGQRLASWSVLALAVVGFATMLAFLILGRENFHRVPSVYLAPIMVALLGVLAWYSRRQPQVGLWVLGGTSLLVLGSILPLMRNLGWIPASFLTQYGTQIGAALEMPLVLIGLYFRSSARRDNRQRMGALENTDPLTGVANHRILVERLQGLQARGPRGPFRGAVMRVRVANLDAIRTEHGREAMEAALVRAAECVTHDMAEGDTVGREEGGDLVMVMQGRVTRTQASEAGRDIIARGLKFSRRLPPTVTLHLRVAAVCAPLPDVDGAAVLALLDRELQIAAADPHGKAMRILANAEDMEHFENGPGAIPHRH
jgi:two-component system, sensor histidine kinase LadS